MFTVFLALLASACLLCFISPRYSLFAILFIGFAQDPFRKLVAGEPFVFVVMVGIVFAAVFITTLNRVGMTRISEPFTGWTNNTQQPLTAFLLVLSLQFFHSYLRFGNPFVSLIGLVSYLAPFFAIVVGYYSVNRAQDIRRFMWFYIVALVIVAISIIMSFVGIEWVVFKEVGSGLKIYDQGTVLRSFSGIMRTGEIAAWHCATAASFLVILYLTSSSKRSTLFVVTLVVLLVTAAVLTGRRKMIMLFTLFIFLYFFTFLYYSKKLTLNYLVLATIVVGLLWIGAQWLLGGFDVSDDFSNYVNRGSSVYNDATGRFVSLGLQPINWAYNRVGLLGGGLGIASQGSQFFANINIAGGAGEGGLGKIMVELGLPGIIVILWLGIAFALYISRSIFLSAQRFVPMHVMPLMLGIAVLLFVNVLTFSVATQVYGDIFILILLGLMAGFLFALPRLVIRAMNDQSTQMARA